MHYIIDGYNLLFRMLHAGDNLQEQRQKLIQDISKKVELLKIDATIVFDAHFQEGELTRTHLKYLEILFTAEGETADEYIIDALKVEKYPRQEVVVTSDKKLAWQARRNLAKTESVEEFLEWLNKRYKNKRRPKKEKAPIPSVMPPKQAQPEAPLSSPSSPHLQATPEECFDYYLNEFVIRYEKETENKKLKKEKKPKKLLQIKSKVHPEGPWFPSEMDRWLHAFDKKGKIEETE